MSRLCNGLAGMYVAVSVLYPCVGFSLLASNTPVKVYYGGLQCNLQESDRGLSYHTRDSDKTF